MCLPPQGCSACTHSRRMLASGKCQNYFSLRHGISFFRLNDKDTAWYRKWQQMARDDRRVITYDADRSQCVCVFVSFRVFIISCICIQSGGFPWYSAVSRILKDSFHVGRGDMEGSRWRMRQREEACTQTHVHSGNSISCPIYWLTHLVPFVLLCPPWSLCPPHSVTSVFCLDTRACQLFLQLHSGGSNYCLLWHTPGSGVLSVAGCLLCFACQWLELSVSCNWKTNTLTVGGRACHSWLLDFICNCAEDVFLSISDGI